MNRPVGLDCPMPNCRGEIVYNGNYFCSLFTYPFEGLRGTCNWALSSDEFGNPIGKRDRDVWEAIQATPWFLNAEAKRKTAHITHTSRRT